MVDIILNIVIKNIFYCVNLFILNLCVGVLKQAPELGFGPFAAHGPCHGHGEHTALCRLQQTEYHSRSECQTLGEHLCIPHTLTQELIGSWTKIKTNKHVVVL